MNLKDFSPDLSRDAVFSPCSRKAFEFWPEFASGNFCMEDIWAQYWWLINLSHLSYCNEKTINDVLEGKVRLIKVFRARTQMAFAVEIEDYTCLVFQGSCTPEDQMLDISFLPKKEDSMSMHRGFNKAFSYIWPEIEAFLSSADSKKLILCGHSLGGALAFITASKVDFHKLVTFGAPRVQFGSKLSIEPERHIRFVNCSDAVPGLPPAIFGFRHVGKMIFIDGEQEIIEDTESNFILSKFTSSSKFFFNGKGFAKGNTPLRTLVDHAPINYSRALSRHLLLK